MLRNEGTTFFRTCLNAINVLSGVGLISIPFALSQGGWTSLIALFILAIICYFMGILLHRCMEVKPQIKTYPDIGALAFGKMGRVIVSIFVYLELYLFAVDLLILGGDSLEKLFPNWGLKVGALRVDGRKTYMMLTALLILPTTWVKSFGALAYVSFGGLLASIVLVGCVVWAGVADHVGFQQRGVVFRLRGFPTAISLYTFCYCAHVVFPTLRSSMTKKTHFPKVLLVSFSLSTLTYGLMAILGYLMYGQNVETQIALSLPQHKINTKIAIFTTLIYPLSKYASIIYPIAQAIEDASPLCATRLMSIIIRTLLLLTTVVVAIAVPFFAYVMAFIGAFTGVATTILIPCICYLKINEGWRKFGWELIVIALIIVVGVSVGLVGTYSSVKELVKRLR
ncbi:Amino acid transporter AVT1J, partial [Cucurbita argyrosperma subsp. sororia]